MLSISARFTPTLIQRYKGPANAALVFAKRAQQLAGEEILGAATLERAQGFFLCSIWSWGSGYRDRSWIFLGIAARMVSILKISQEESYNLPAQPQVEDVIRARSIAEDVVGYLHERQLAQLGLWSSNLF
ncbi:hypothetical protein MPER_01454 [Moniliophthora perniciosa FA553]|nr:hypothetical protein MPER_01454 [Moniliophthora perniciosa FA553]